MYTVHIYYIRNYSCYSRAYKVCVALILYNAQFAEYMLPSLVLLYTYN